jgi:hypothetical protein
MRSGQPVDSGAFGEALVDAVHIRSFIERDVASLKVQETGLAAPWRSGFRAQLPYHTLLGERQRQHLRGIFAHLLPAPDVPPEDFERDERILLDVLSETYVMQAQVFIDLMGSHDYEVVDEASREVGGRIIALSLSASIFFLDIPDRNRQRLYRYRNIYGNKELTPEGRCRLRSTPRLAKPLKAAEFRSSPIMMLALHPEGIPYRLPFMSESQVVSNTFTSRMAQVTFHASQSFFNYTNPGAVLPEAPGTNEDDEDRGDGGDPPEPSGSNRT